MNSMNASPFERDVQTDLIFVVETTSMNGAFINDLKNNYILQTLEYFNQGPLDANEYLCESSSTLFGLVTYQCVDVRPKPCCKTFGEYTNPQKLLLALDKCEFIGGRGEECANLVEGLATALAYLDEIQDEVRQSAEKYVILVCNSPFYSVTVTESASKYFNYSLDDLTRVFVEKGVKLSVISARKIPAFFKLFEKMGGDLPVAISKNYAKDPRHLILLNGYTLKERPASPCNVTPVPSVSVAPVGNVGSPAPTPFRQIQNIGIQPGMQAQPAMQNQVQQQQQQQPQVVQQMQMQQQQQQQQQQQMNPRAAMQASYMQCNAPGNFPRGPQQQQQRWQMSQQRGFPPPSQSQQPSALIRQLTQPPSSMPLHYQQNMETIPMNSCGMNQGPPQQQQQIQQQHMQNIQMQQQQQMRMLSTQQQQLQQQPMPGNMPMQMGMPTMPDRQIIWQGILEWVDKSKASDAPKLPKMVPCTVSSIIKDGEPEVKAENWPQKLGMQLLPRHLISSIGGTHLKNSLSVMFHPSTMCEALDDLIKLMNGGFAGCVQFNSVANTCELKILILLFASEKRSFLGFIPNDQQAFVERLRRLIQQSKRATMPAQVPPNAVMNVQQQIQPNSGNMFPMGQGMGGGMAGAAPMAQAMSPVPGMAIPPNATIMQPQMPPQGSQMMRGNAGSGAGSGPNINPQTGEPSHLVAARQQNLQKILELRQTLEAAQQQELQYKSQLEIMNHMQIQQLQQTLETAQQRENQFKALEHDQQKGIPNIRMQMQLQQQSQGQQRQIVPQGQAQMGHQPRMRGPMVTNNNPGLRHLLQQQPQYRQQLMMQNRNQQQQNMMQQQQQQQQGNPQFDDPTFDFLN